MATNFSILAWESHGQRSLTGRRHEVGKESDMTEETKQQKAVFDDFKVVWKFLSDCIDLRQRLPSCSVNPFLLLGTFSKLLCRYFDHVIDPG